MSHLNEFPLARPTGRPFDPPTALGELRTEEPVARMTYPDGHEGWVVTGYAESRAVLGDQRFSSRQELLRMPYLMPGMEARTEMPPAAGDMTGIDAPEHTRFRRLLVGKFTVRRMRQLTERVEEVTAEHLAAMRELGPEVDLVQAFAHPVPAVMICELLGVPYADRDTFQRYVSLLFSADAPAQERYEGIVKLQEYVGELVQAKRSEPTDDLFSDLTTTDLTDDELAGIGSLLLAAGLDTTTANQIALGSYALLRHPAQISLLLKDPDRGVEELLRYLTITHTNVRTALADVEIGGQVIKAGETVTLSLQAANRDPLRFSDPDELDLTREAIGHLTFGHGIHQCLGQQLARVEMRVAMPALFTAFPTLRPASEPALRPGQQSIYGVQYLPVTWEDN